MRTKRKALWWLTILLFALGSQVLLAQAPPAEPFTTTVPGGILNQFRAQKIVWTTNVWVYANHLFAILALIEFTWSAAVMLLEKSDLQSWTSALVRKIMWIGAFYALLLNGSAWLPAIIDSFTQIGAGAAGLGKPLAPSDIFIQGLGIAGALMDAASTSAFFTNPGTSLALAFCALLIVVSYVIITLNFIVTMVETYLLLSVGFIFLGFGGSRWTAPYVERYIALAVSIGIKIVLLYCLIAAGLGLGNGWLDEAQGVGTAPHPNLTAFDVMGAAVIFMMLCWQIPKLFSAVLGGAPALTGGDLISTATGLFAGSAMVASLGAEGAALGARGLAAISGVATAASNGGGSSGTSGPGAITAVGPILPGGSGGATANGVPPPPTPPPSAPNGGRAHQPDPPLNVAGVDSVNLAAVGSPSNRGSSPSNTGVIDTPALDRNGTNSNTSAGAMGLQGVGAPATSAERALSGVASRLNSMRRQFRVIPSDSAAHSTPPRMPIDHQE